MKLSRNFCTDSRLVLLLCAILSVTFLASCGKHDPFPLDKYEDDHLLSPPTSLSVTPTGKGAGGTISITWNLSRDDRYGWGSIIYKPDSSDTVLDFDKVLHVIEKPSDKPINLRQVRYEIFRAVLQPGKSTDTLTDNDFLKVGEVEEGVGQFDDNPILGLDNADSWWTGKEAKLKAFSRDSRIIRNEKGYEVLQDTEKGEYLFERFLEINPYYSPDNEIDNPNYYLMVKESYRKAIPRQTKEIGTEANEYWKQKYLNKHIEQYNGWSKKEISYYEMTKEGSEKTRLDCDIETHKKALADKGWSLSPVDVSADIYEDKDGKKVLIHRDMALLIEAQKANGCEMLRVDEGVLFVKISKRKLKEAAVADIADLKTVLEKLEAVGVTEMKLLPRAYEAQLADLTTDAMGWAKEEKKAEKSADSADAKDATQAEGGDAPEAKDAAADAPKVGETPEDKPADEDTDKDDKSAEPDADKQVDKSDDEKEKAVVLSEVLTKGNIKLTLVNSFDFLVRSYEVDGWKVERDDVDKQGKIICTKGERSKEIFWDADGYVKENLKEAEGWSKAESKSCFVYEKDGEFIELEKSTEDIKKRWESEGWATSPRIYAYVFEKDGKTEEVARNLKNEYVLDGVASDKNQWVLYRGEMTARIFRNAISRETKKALQDLKDEQWLVDVKATEAAEFKKYILRKYDSNTSSYTLTKELETKFVPMSEEDFKKAITKQILLGWEVAKVDDEGVLFKVRTVIRREYESTREDHIARLASGWEYDPGEKEYTRKKNTAQITVCGLVNDNADKELAKYLNGDEKRFEEYFASIRQNLKQHVQMTDDEIDVIFRKQLQLTKWKLDELNTTDRHYALKRDEQTRTVTKKVELKPYEVPIEIARMKSRGYVVDTESLQTTRPDAQIPADLVKALNDEGVGYNVDQDGRVYIPFVKKSDYMEFLRSDHFLDEEIEKLLSPPSDNSAETMGESAKKTWVLDEQASDDVKMVFRRPFDVESAADEYDTAKLEQEKEYQETMSASGKARKSPLIPVEGRSAEDEHLRYVFYRPEQVQRINRSWQDVGEKTAKAVEDKLMRGMSRLAGSPDMLMYGSDECDRKLIDQGSMYVYRVDFVQDPNRDGTDMRRASSVITTPVMPYANYFDYDRLFVLIVTIIFIVSVSYFIVAAKRGKNFYIRPIAGINAVEEAVGRAAETGKTVMYLPGIGGVSDIATLASLAILSRIAEKAATYDTGIISPNYDPIVLQVAQEVIKESYMKAGRPDAYKDDMAFFLSQRQFAYAAGVSGLIAREKPATIFLMGVFFAESLLLAEAGNTVGALQIAGTDRDHQLPFFVTACDYTLIGEELYAAGAYLSRDPKLLGSLKGQDWFKAFCVIMTVILLLGALTFQITGTFDIYWIVRELFSAKFSSPF